MRNSTIVGWKYGLEHSSDAEHSPLRLFGVRATVAHDSTCLRSNIHHCSFMEIKISNEQDNLISCVTAFTAALLFYFKPCRICSCGSVFAKEGLGSREEGGLKLYELLKINETFEEHDGAWDPDLVDAIDKETPTRFQLPDSIQKNTEEDGNQLCGMHSNDFPSNFGGVQNPRLTQSLQLASVDFFIVNEDSNTRSPVLFPILNCSIFPSSSLTSECPFTLVVPSINCILQSTSSSQSVNYGYFQYCTQISVPLLASSKRPSRSYSLQLYKNKC
eukprot:Gb_38379 [translate_table: standard]